MKVGDLFKFVHAPPRWPNLLGEVGVVLDGPVPESHNWGGLYSVLVNGQTFRYYGDFMEVISEGR